VTLSRRTLLELMREHPAVTDALLTSLGHMIRRLTERASDLVFLDLTGRVAKLLLSFAEEIGSDIDDGTMLDLQLTQTDLAAMVGGTRQSVNQILRTFERRGYLELRGRRIIVKSKDALTRLSER
jgi:CRP/FNR family cyclic AMP-dependent transcriptional regulator